MIGVIAILGGLLFAGISRARGRALRVECSNVLRQIYLVTVAYSGENEGWLPGETYFTKDKVVPPFCPSDERPRYSSYTFSGFRFGKRPKDRPSITDNDGSSPSLLGTSKWLVQERFPWHDPDREPPPKGVSGRHDGRYNMLFGDGQIKWKYLGPVNRK